MLTCSLHLSTGVYDRRQSCAQFLWRSFVNATFRATSSARRIHHFSQRPKTKGQNERKRRDAQMRPPKLRLTVKENRPTL